MPAGCGGDAGPESTACILYSTSATHNAPTAAAAAGRPHACCVCNKPASELGPEHALNCPKISNLVMFRHDAIAKALKHALLRAGLTMSLEPHFSAFRGMRNAEKCVGTTRLPAPPGCRRRHRRARGDVLFYIGGELIIIDVSVINALSPTVAHVAAGGMQDGAAAAKRNQQTKLAYADRGGQCSR